MKKLINLYSLALAAFMLAPLASTHAAEVKDLNTKANNSGKGGDASPKGITQFGCAAPSARAELDINNIRALIHNGGDMWWDLLGSARYEVPKTTDLTQRRLNSMFAGGIWIGGNDGATGDPIVMAQTYRQQGQITFWPGPIDNITAATTQGRCSEWNQIFTCEKRTVLQFTFDVSAQNLIVPIPESQIPEQIRYWPGRNNRFLRTRPGAGIQSLNFNLAPFVDLNANGNYEPDLGEYPQLPGDDGTNLRDIISSADQCLWFVTNDVGGNKIFRAGQPVALAIGMEVQTEAFAYATSDQRNDMTFYRNLLTNKGQRTVLNCYFGQWADPDLGNPSDDYVGFDVPRGFGYCYNGDDNDDGPLGYGLNPPTIGIDYFIGPQADPFDGVDNDKNCQIDETNEKIIASDFMYYNNTSDTRTGNPVSVNDYYNYLRNIWRDGTLVSYDGIEGKTIVGQPYPGRPDLGAVIRSLYIFPGTSDQEVCWGNGGNCAGTQFFADGTTQQLQPNPCPNGILPNWDERSAGNPPGDRRFLISAGPFTLRPGASNNLTIGVVWARASSGGALGSLNQLLIADDISQRLFDRNFKIILGPNEPKVDITELDGELIMTITPDVFQGVSTEDYTITDPNLNPLFGDTAYRFEGYIVYQLRDATVGTADLDDPNRAQIIAQFDRRNGVGTIFNQEFDPVTAQLLPVLKVQGQDRGIQNVIRITRDAFNPELEGLVNFRTYFYRVVAYAYNSNSQNLEPFLPGFPRVDPVTGTIIDRIPAIPHKRDPERFGTVLRSEFDQGLPITRVAGTGNGGYRLTLKAGQEEQIVNQGSLQRLDYEANAGPLRVRVVNPTQVRDGNFEITIFSRLAYNPQNSTYQFQVGDTIRSLLDYSLILVQFPNSLKDTVGRRAGIAAVKKVNVIRPDSVELIVETLNDAERPVFAAEIEFRSCNDPFNCSIGTSSWEGYETRPFPFVRYSPATNTMFTDQRGDLLQYWSYDYWEMIHFESGIVVPSRRQIREANEQLIPEFGFGVTLQHAINPGVQVELNRLNGNPQATLTHTIPTNPWFLGVNSLQQIPLGADWLQDNRESGNPPSPIFSTYVGQDPGQRMNQILDGIVAPYHASQSGGTPSAVNAANGARRPVPPNNELGLNVWANLRSVKIVFTQDKSKWTKCIVLQHDSVASGNTIRNQLWKSRVPSVDINGNPTGEQSPYEGSRNPASLGELSRGVSWFPGYAIDIERGIRLDLAFSESYTSGNFVDRQGSGNDLQFEYNELRRQVINTPDGEQITLNIPTDTLNKNFLYVLTTEYKLDGSSVRELERRFDSIQYEPNNALVRNVRYSNLLVDIMSWVVYPGKDINRQINGDAIIDVNIDRAYEAWTQGPPIEQNLRPTYQFTTEGFSVLARQDDAAKRALGLIRVVPNPYYAYNSDAASQVDSRVKITNLPTKSTVSIYNLSGTLVRRFNLDFTGQQGLNQTTFVDWDLRNQVGIPVASGTYLIHIDAGQIGQTVVKFFGVMRPIDLDGVQVN